MPLPQAKMSLQAFLDWENQQPGRNEFYRGEVFAMVGARRVHGIVALNVATALKMRLQGKPCRAFIESMKVRVADDAVFYPDVFVTCDARDLRTEMVFEHPVLIVEVLSASTQAFDRGAKFAAYRGLTSLREYVLIDPDTRGVEVFRRNERGLFELHDQSGTAVLALASVDARIPMAEVFEGVEAAPAADAGAAD
ncbi:Uma2 family endonuclease [Metallibacterium sp.]|uniref:Uma2 family endonuclease n=1 Tax=Metallibacterium sp. TaxID=2940281 RepID=UPI0026277164|nr:Uma2 family endonuclease [Metallibacterium sp.]